MFHPFAWPRGIEAGLKIKTLPEKTSYLLKLKAVTFTSNKGSENEAEI